MIGGLVFWLAVFAGVGVYWLLPRFRDEFLIAVSFAFLGYVNAQPVLAQEALGLWQALGGIVLANLTSLGMLLCWFALFRWVAPRTAENSPRALRVLTGLILLVLGYLAVFKYIPPMLAFLNRQGFSTVTLKLALPLGISYFTFKLIHYAIEVSRGQIKEHSSKSLLLYLLLFTIFPAGPIERFDHFLANRQQTWSSELLAVGLQRIIFGLIKKFFIADCLILPYVTYSGVNTEDILVRLESVPVILVWIHVLLWFLYFYLDFSAYSDLAIGCSRLFGLTIQENFNHPLTAINLADFWRHWHMSLATWCRAYVYMPLIGLTRNPYLAVYATMLSIGLWHGGSLAWLLWGFHHATGLAIYQTWTRVKRKFKWKDTDNPLAKVAARALTVAFVAAATCYPITQQFEGGVLHSFRLLLKLIGITWAVD